jgi:predicted unusual protein kinase regulating ubiquinone biosynthesis (AarF/ABC1/UbiB family)
VFRAFTSLDGIGKGLDTNYDLTKLAKPFLKELIDLRDGSATMSFLKSVGKKLGWRPVDISDAISFPRKIAYLKDTISKMEDGDLKMRVRVLDSEKEFQRLKLVQDNLASAIVASAFLNVGVVLANGASSWGKLNMVEKLSLLIAGVFGIKLPIGLLKVKQLDKKYSELSQ